MNILCLRAGGRSELRYSTCNDLKQRLYKLLWVCVMRPAAGKACSLRAGPAWSWAGRWGRGAAGAPWLG